MADQDQINAVRRKVNEFLTKGDEKIVFGYAPTKKKRKEGETWTDADEKQWIVKDGLVQSVSKLQSARTPMFCPSCSKIMTNRLDEKYWRMRDKCMDCVIKDETQMRVDGTWKQFEEDTIKKNYIAELQLTINELTDYRNTLSSPTIVHADENNVLAMERWNVDLVTIKEDITKDIEQLQKYLDEALEEENEK